MRKVLVICLGLLATIPAVSQEQAALVPSGIGASVAENYVTPSLAAFTAATTHLRSELEELCAAPGEDRLRRARSAFADTIAAWGPVSILRFGPLVEESRFEHLFFWPDPRGVILRQVQALLAGEDAETATPSGLAGKSVAVQGLPALEFVLFGSGSEILSTGGTYRCRYGAAIAANGSRRAAELAHAWAPGEPLHVEFTRPDPSNMVYRSPAEVAGEVIKALGTGLQFTRDAELLPALGDSAEKANGRRAPFWRSDLTFALVDAQIEAMVSLIHAAGFEAQLDDSGRAIIGSLLFELEHAQAAIGGVDASADAAFADEDDRGRIAYATIALQGANRRVSEQLSAALGLRMGFNALDGD